MEGYNGLITLHLYLPGGKDSSHSVAGMVNLLTIPHSTEFSGWEMQVHPDSPLRSGFAG